MNWQKIETAPIDQMILTFDQDGFILLSMKVDMRVCLGPEFTEGVDPEYEWSGYDGSSEHIDFNPTHWMYLPDPPGEE